MRALVTGITGFVGGHLTEHLTALGDLVVGLSTSGQWPDALAHLARRARLEACNLTQVAEHDLADLLTRKQPEVIYHLAAQANPQASIADPRGTWALNLGGVLNLLEAVKTSGLGSRVILVGSGVSYGAPSAAHLPVGEDCPLRPSNPYAASKAAADLLGIQHHVAHGTNVLMVRPFNHAGPRQSPSYVLSALARQVAEVELRTRACVEVGNLDVVRDFTDVRDVVRAYRLLAEHGLPGEIYNLGTGQGTRISDAMETLRALAGVSVKVCIDPGRMRPIDQQLLVANPSKLRAATGWKPCWSINQTLADMLDYWRATLGRPGPSF